MSGASRDRALAAALLIGLAALLAISHIAQVEDRYKARRAEIHAEVLANRAPDPYQYKMFAVTWAVEGIHRATGVSVNHLYMANTTLALLALVLAHHLFLSRLYGRKVALAGAFLLAAYCHGQFRDYQHHPYDFWGVALYCLLLDAVVRGRSALSLAGLSLATGALWDKHFLVPALAAGRRWRRGEAILRSLAGGLLGVAAAVAVPVALRVALGTDRHVVDVTFLDEQAWGRVVRNHLPLMGPALLVLILAWKRLPDWVRWLWLTVPIVLAAYLVTCLMIDELRSFWVFVPIYTATICGWLARDDGPAGAPSPAAP